VVRGVRGAIALTQLLVAGTIVAGGAGAGVALDQTGVFGGGDETVEVSLDAVSVYDCPDGAESGEVHRGDRVLATGRDGSGAWIEIRDPRDLGARVWVKAPYLVPDADLSGLDVRDCEEVEVALPTTTTAPSDGGGGGGGTAADTTGPTISGVSANPNEIWETFPSLCGEMAKQSTITASASDPAGIASLTASWAFGPVNQTKNIPAQFGPFPYLTVPDNTQPTITITITARDTHGNTRTATTTVVVHSAAQCSI